MSLLSEERIERIPSSIYQMDKFSASRYDEEMSIPDKAQIQLVEQLINGIQLHSRSELSVLSIGVGTGRLDIPFLESVLNSKTRIFFTAVEPSHPMLKRFRDKLRNKGFIFKDSDCNDCQNRNVQVKLIEKTFTIELNLHTDSNFDVILALFVLHAIPNWRDSLIKMLNLLKPDGFIVFAEECGDIQWLDNRLIDMNRIEQIWREKDQNAEAKSRWMHYRFWQEYHRIRREEIGKGWYPEISATDLGPVKIACRNLAALGYGRWETQEAVEWIGKGISFDTLLCWLKGEEVLFTPLMLWGLTQKNLDDLEKEMRKWAVDHGNNTSDTIARMEGHKFYFYQKPASDSKQFENLFRYYLRKVHSVGPRLIENIDFNKIQIERKRIDEKESIGDEKKIYSHASNRLNLFYQQHFRGSEPIVLAYVSWDLWRKQWWFPLPILIAGVRSEKIEDFVASYAFYPWFRAPEKELLSLNELMLREMPESFIFQIKRDNHIEVRPSFYRKSGRPVSVEISVPISLDKFQAELSALRSKLASRIKGKIENKIPVVGEVTIIDYEDFAEEAKAEPSDANELRRKLTVYFEEIEKQLSGKIKEYFKFINDAYTWTPIEEKNVSELARLLPQIFLIGSTTDYWLKEIQWIPGKGILDSDRGQLREQSFGGILVLKLGEVPEISDEDELNELTLIQTLESCLDGIRETNRSISYEILKGGTKAAVTALGARNMSHHTGSHILHWLENEAREEAIKFQKMAVLTKDSNQRIQLKAQSHYFKSKTLFCIYLRERMDLVASMAVFLPVWTTKMTLDELKTGIKPSDPKKGDSLVLRHIGRSEGVYNTDIYFIKKCKTCYAENLISQVSCHSCKNKLPECEVSMPGSALGRQAFYGIIENVARDAAKYGDIHSDEVVLVEQCKNGGDYWIEYKDSGSQFRCWRYFHGTSNKIQRSVLDKLNSTVSKRILVVIINKDSENCSAARNPWMEEDSKYIFWEASITNNCDHQVCILLKELIELMNKSKYDGVCKKAKELDCALQSIRVEVSELINKDFNDNGRKNANNPEQSQIIKEAIENLYRVIVNDDRSSYRKNSSYLSNAITKIENDGLCESTGMLRIGDWGIKERYIFASYLRGEKPEVKLLPEKIRLGRPVFPPILRVENCSEKLGWVFYMLKPKDILIISDEHKKEDIPEQKRDRINVWNWEIFSQTDLTSSSLRHKFVILCPNDKTQAAQIKNILIRLPFRVFVCDKNIKSSATTDLPLYANYSEDLNLANLEVEQLYKEWINFIRNSLKRNVPDVVSVVGKNENITDGFPSDWKYKISKSDSLAVFDRHGAYSQAVKNKNKNFFHYEPFVKTWAVERYADISNLRRQPSLIFPLQEAASIRILVIDERLDSSLDRIGENFGNEVYFTLREIWEMKGVDVIGQEFKGQGEEFLNDEAIIELIKAKSRQLSYVFVLLHQGILDKLYNKKKGNVESDSSKRKTYAQELISKILTQGVWHVIIHSGRGGVQDLPEGVKFIHLSSLETWFGSNLSKADVVDEIMNLRRE